MPQIFRFPRAHLNQAIRQMPGLLLAALLFCSAGGTRAAQLTWDPLANGSGTAGSSNWNTTAGNTIWYDGASDVVWSQGGNTSPTMGATFNGPDAAAGSYVVTLDAGQIAVTNLTINSSGYSFTGLNNLYLGANEFINVAAGKSVDFSCNLAGSGTAPCWVLGNGASMNVSGNMTSGQQVRLAGPATSAFNLTGTANAPAIVFVLAPVNLNSGALTPSASFYIGYRQTLPAPNSTAYDTGILNISGASTALTVNGNILIIGRSDGTGTLNLFDGTATVGNLTANRNLAIDYDGSAGSHATVNVYGGTLNVGSSSQTANQIDFFQTAANATATALLNQTGGLINAWGGVIFGAASGNFSGGSATWVQSGGTMLIGSKGIAAGANYTAANNNVFSVTLSGGTIGALANWASAVPLTLSDANGNTTFQCGDNNGTPYVITLSGPLTGDGGMNVTGNGSLNLSGANSFAGGINVSNGTVVVITGASPSTNGPVRLDASTGSPAVTVDVSNPGQYWTNNGSLTCANAVAGTPAVNFQFGVLAPSTSVAPWQVSGNVALSATPSVTITGSAIANGVYPLIKYTGTLSGALPSSLNLPGYISSASLRNIAASKTIALIVTGSTYNPALFWRVGDGVWDIGTSANWSQFGGAATYANGEAVVFDDSASGPSPITITLNSTVNPLEITANNASRNYTISGPGSITGSGSLTMLGAGSLTLTGTNTYSGGTVVNAGTLIINAGGNTNLGSPIGTGPLVLNNGASLDNTSGTNVALQPAIPEFWSGTISYIGSANDFSTGPGQVTLTDNTTVSVGGRNLIVPASITDNGNNLTLSKTGNGSLTLATGNAFAGLKLYAGTLNLADPGAAGIGSFNIFGGAIDNTSGADMALSPASYTWSASFSFLGTTNLDLSYPAITIPNGPGSITLNIVSNTLITGGDIMNNNTTVIKTGAGTWEIGGASSGGQSLGLIVAEGQVNFHKLSSQVIQNGNNIGLTVQTGGRVLDENSYQVHSASAIPIPVVLSGGVWDLNGFNENIDKLSLSNGGTLRNGAAASTSSITAISGYTAQLSGTNCQFDVAAADGVLNFNGTLGGSGSLVKVGLGLLNLSSNNTYAGDTTVTGGLLALAFPSLAANSTVALASGAGLQLNFPGTNVISALVLNGASQPAGIYNAANTSAYLSGPGTLQVNPSLPTSPTKVMVSVSGSTLSLSWPANYRGWLLQTNAGSVSLRADWHDVPGSETNTSLSVPLNGATAPAEYFRLRHP